MLPVIITKSHQLLPVARSLINTERPIIVEAGAFWGHDTLRMAQLWPFGFVHAFEPVPSVFNTLVKNTAEASNIKCYQQALSNVDGFIDLHIAYKKDRVTQASSVHSPYKRLELSTKITFPEKITVPALTLASFMQQQSINGIDLLWLDLQGHELPVLAANTAILTQIKIIHMEVYFVQAYNDHVLYGDILLWLRQHNFVVVAQDFKNEVDHFFGNILCMRKDIISF
ncbi:FkbM family methyltransferase [Candidatus Dependentiae bacterium]|nr:MAG: FkbM family methyltransferase [Candidatus Dependentiae bacterium]